VSQILTLLLLATVTAVAAAQEGVPPAISDNSFLIEEAYNQEPHVVQHISGLQLFRGDDSWVYTFTQEWPLSGRKNQLSYTLPLERAHSGTAVATGLGDVAVNYRYQLAAADRLSVAPRLSVLLPTGSSRSGLGAGAFGAQVNLPVSVSVARQLVTHWNAGTTLTHSARSAYNLGASAIWLARPTFNVLVEVVWTRDSGGGDDLVVSPGIRWAHNLSGGLQIVPGLAYAFDVGPLVYLSFEHPFGGTAH
jgi:hypothetical protein